MTLRQYLATTYRSHHFTSATIEDRQDVLTVKDVRYNGHGVYLTCTGPRGGQVLVRIDYCKTRSVRVH